MSTTRTSRSWRLAAGAVALAIVAFVIYWPALSGQFIWDDAAYVTASPLIRAADGIYRMWFTTEPIDYWPVTNTLYWFEWRAWHSDPTGYHVLSACLHVANALLFWRILRRLDIQYGWLAALLFVAHPVNVESVAWIAERKNTLSMLFLLVSTLLYLESDPTVRLSASSGDPKPEPRRSRKIQTARTAGPPDRQPDRSNTRLWYLLSVLAFLLAMLSKGSVAAFPAMLLLLAWWQRGNLTRTDVTRVLPYAAIAIVLTVVNIWFQARHVTGPLRDITPLERLLGAGAIVWFYLSKALVPVNLMFVYPEWHTRADDWRWWVPLAAVISTTVILWRMRRRDSGRGLFLAWGVLCLALVPVLGLTDAYYMRYSPVADRYAYLALLPVTAVVAAGLHLLGRRIERWSSRTNGVAIARLVAVCLAMVLGFATWRQSRLYADSTTLWAATLQRNPTCWLCEVNLVVPLVASGSSSDLTEAMPHLNAAIRINPRAPESHAGLGVVLQKMGRLDEAVDEYERALALNPHFSEARSNLIIAREQLGISQAANDRFDEAAATLRLVLQEAPDRAAAHRELAYALLRLGRTDDSIAHAREAIRLEPASPDNHGTLAEIWRDLHRQNEAIAEYQEAVRLAPTSAEWHNNLGAALLDADRLEDAVREFRDAVRWDPRSPQAHRNLGVALAQMGQPQEAAVHLREALRLQPDFPDAQANLDEITGRVRKD
jgi:Flp pilus assembly protein TadD